MNNLLNNIQGWVENGYAGNHLMAETDTGVAAGGLGRTIGDAVIAFNKANVMLPLVTSKQAVRGSTHVQFADYTKLATSDVGTPGDGADETTVTSVQLALSHIFGSMRQLRSAGAPMPYNLVLSPKQVWGAKGLSGLLQDAAVTGSNSKPMSLMGAKGEETMMNGSVGSIAGFDVYWSDQIDEDVSSGGDAAGFAFSRGAIGLAIGVDGLFRLETERNASFRTTEYVVCGFWGEIEIKDGFGVYVLSDVS